MPQWCCLKVGQFDGVVLWYTYMYESHVRPSAIEERMIKTHR